MGEIAEAVGFILIRQGMRSRQKIEWNKGACTCGMGWMRSFDMDSGGATGYRCTYGKCQRVIWLDWYRPEEES